MKTERVVIVGGCRLGKSTLAREFRAQGIPTFCCDPRSEVKDPEADVTYLEEGLGMGPASSQWVVDHWLPMPGPWCIEGHLTARVLRKWWFAGGRGDQNDALPCDRVIVITREPFVDLLRGQRSLNKAVETEWNQVAMFYEPIVEYV